MPTLFELLGLRAPEICNGIPQLPIHGISMAYTFDAPTAPTRKEAQYFEMFGHRAIRHDGWKAVSCHQRGTSCDDDQWELYHHDTDLSECDDLAQERPEQLQKMISRFWVEAGKYDVLPLDDNGFAYRAKIPRPGSPRKRTTFAYYPGMAHLPGAAVPPVMNRREHGALRAHRLIRPQAPFLRMEPRRKGLKVSGAPVSWAAYSVRRSPSSLRPRRAGSR